MPKYDAESLMSDIQAILVSKLNTKISAVEAEKIAAGFPNTGLKQVDFSQDSAGNYVGLFEQSWSDRILNVNPAIFFGIEEVKAEGAGPSTGELFKIWVDVVLVDSGQDILTKNRIYRYSRALKEIFEENWDTISSFAAKIKIETVRPMSFRLDLNTSEVIKIGGVSITTAFA